MLFRATQSRFRLTRRTFYFNSLKPARNKRKWNTSLSTRRPHLNQGSPTTRHAGLSLQNKDVRTGKRAIWSLRFIYRFSLLTEEGYIKEEKFSVRFFSFWCFHCQVNLTSGHLGFRFLSSVKVLNRGMDEYLLNQPPAPASKTGLHTHCKYNLRISSISRFFRLLDFPCRN